MSKSFRPLYLAGFMFLFFGMVVFWACSQVSMFSDALLSAGNDHACALIDKDIECWGADLSGQAQAPSGEFEKIALGAYHSCAMDGDGLVTCWGNNSSLQCEPPQERFKAFDCGGNRCCGVKREGGIRCWA